MNKLISSSKHTNTFNISSIDCLKKEILEVKYKIY